ncbi:Cof-type HAD-IIB family hydrolase [Paenisporosarcina sp. TG-14]|uniref:Cof-type HAD-IIB family hydrolase n=1 Tax=Paenisporosarcina sp. TG-14 TaxID=1231057 RepID=UPI0002E8242A|nr:Cof-type HAD-IIB family hydrolase [Paenisporosarcina sp. TG-14]
MKKVLFFDIDGTLYDSNKQLPIKAKEAVFEARNRGHEVVIATGRAPFMIQEVLKELEIDSYICFNGQYVVYQNKVISHNEISPIQLKLVSDFAREHNHPMVYMNAEKMISSITYHPQIEESMNSLKFPHPNFEENFIVNNKIYQALLFCSAEEELAYQENFPHLKFVRWHRVSADILPKGASKANAVKFICQKFNIDIKDTIAFGDGLNDIEMLEAVGYGVVMGNGHEEALKRANYVTTHVDDDGLVNAMKYLKLI